jgi:hypothetical protein
MKLNEVAQEIRELISKRQDEIGLTFTEEDHIYMMNGKNDYPSVSGVLKKFFRAFPSVEAAYNKAGGNPEKQQQLLEEWAAAGTYATNMGSRVHYFLEKDVIERNGEYKEVRQPIFECDASQILKADGMIKGGKKYLDLMEERGAVLLDTEIVMGDPELGYTGQPDKVWLMENKDKTEFGIVITDWKTNKKKNFQQSEFTERMYLPFQKYPNNALGHYYVQLPLYGKLLLKMLEGTKYENVKLYGCVVTHLNGDGEFEEYRVPGEVVSTVLDMNMKDYL